MANQKNFAITPSVSISRSKFRRPSQHKTTFNLGEICPIYVDSDILPGDTVSLDLAALVRMSTPMAPIMDNIYIDYYAFFVPNRLVWDNWKQFMGENTSSFGAASEPTFPTARISSSLPITVGCLGDHLGLPVYSGTQIEVSAIPGRCYYLIYNEWWRDQNLVIPFNIYKSDGVGPVAADTTTSPTSYLHYNGPLLKAAKESDYFTRALPYAQKGSPVTLPLGATAPVGFIDDGNSTIPTGGAFGVFKQTVVNGFNQLRAGDSSGTYMNGGNTKIVADLSNATAATINQLRISQYLVPYRASFSKNF